VETAELNLAWCDALVAGLVGAGVTRSVVSPGSRSTPLVLALDRHPGMAVTVLPDERSAAFLALGLARAGTEPVAVAATSGSAPTHWHPAVAEAAADGLPLVLLSADRPAELHHRGANQTLDQTRLFGEQVRGFFALGEAHADRLAHAADLAARAVDRALWPWPGPVHLNIPLREPLVPGPEALERLPAPHPAVRVDRPALVPGPGTVAELAGRLSGRPGLIVCGRGAIGRGFAAGVVRLARALGAPVLADPLSGLRFGGHDRGLVLTRYDAFLRASSVVRGLRPDWVLRLGGAPTGRPLLTYLEGLPPGGQVLVVPAGPWPDPGCRAGWVVHAAPDRLPGALAEMPLDPAPGDWTAAWLSLERRAAERLDATPAPPLEAELMATLARRMPAGGVLFLGNSMAVRDADAFLAGGEKPLTVTANRGVSGIDGQVSTALGLAAAGRPCVAVLGDLAFYHDMNGLLAARGLDATLVVVDNGGGAIFGHLPQAGLPHFERYWLTPTGLDIGRIAQLYGLAHRRVGDAPGFEASLLASLAAPGVQVIQACVDREQSLARHRAYWRSVASA
jgi:2-succinyl-5-enolpyruvyl-6-hydroxy-3-cyclohexene-1-carboxylate synthase